MIRPPSWTRIFFAVSSRRQPRGWWRHVIRLYSAALALWVVYAAVIAIVAPLALTAIFLSFIMVPLFLLTQPGWRDRGQTPTLVDIALALSALGCGLYFVINTEVIVSRISLLDPLTSADLFFGTLLMVLAIEATRRTVGGALTIITIIFIIYNLGGHQLPGVLGHGRIDYEHFIDQSVFTTNGIFGAPVRVAATYAFLFVLFGTLLEKSGGSAFFFNLAAIISGRRPGGPAKVAVFSSALFGTISGSPTSDVVTTGAVTIPLMRRLGYSRAMAGGVEVAASTSGGILPPVMGSAAFIMVEFTGIDYRTIAVAALIPAILYLLGVYTQVHLRALRQGLKGMSSEEIPKLREVIAEGGLFFVPLAAIIYALLQGYSVSYVAIHGIGAVLAVSMMRSKTRLSPGQLLETLAITCQRMIPVAAACAAAGLVVGGISMTGLSGKFAHLIYLLSGDNMLVALAVAGLVAILLGMGMPTPSAYIMAAVLVAPTLVEMGFELLPVHMFVLFFAVLSAITPPVAVAAFAASSIAEENPMLIAITAVRLASVAFILPFVFAFYPLLLASGPLLPVLYAAITAGLGVILLAAASEGYARNALGSWQRIAFAIAGIFLVVPGLTTDAIAILLVGLVIFIDHLKNPSSQVH